LAGSNITDVASGGNWTPAEKAVPNIWPHTYSRNRSSSFYGYYQREVKTGQQNVSIGIVPLVVGTFDDNDFNDVIAKLGERYDQHGFDTAVFVGELGESVDMLATRFRQVASVVSAVKKGRLDKAVAALKKSGVGNDKLRKLEKEAKALNGKGWKSQRKQRKRLKLINDVENNSVSNTILEVQYGLRPLLGDIYEMSKAIAKYDKPRKARISSQTRRSLKPTVGSSLFEWTGGGSSTLRYIGYLEELLDPTLSEAMGLTNPWNVVWELVPFSFVVDWALPVGDYIRARNAAQRMKGKFVRTIYSRYSIASGGPSAYYPHKASGSGKNVFLGVVIPSQKTYHNVARTVLGSMSAEVKLPGFKIPIKGPGERLLNAVSLLASIFIRKK
jgi:hypothetical protein